MYVLSWLLAACAPGAAPVAEAPAPTWPEVERLPPVDPADEAGAAVFDPDVVHAISLALGADARAALAADPTTYVEGTFSDGVTTLPVGVRLKGATSFQTLDGKPNVRISFDHFVDGQRYDGLEAVDLVSEAEDPAAMSEAIAYHLFRAAGQPASRTGFAWLVIDAAEYGLYTLVEKKDDVLLRRWWPDDAEGSLYESSTEAWPCDLDDGGDPRCDCWEQDEIGRDDARADLEALCAVATDNTDEDWREAVDDEEVLGHVAMEMVLDAYDHYAGYMGNVYLYHQPEAQAWALIPASMNSAFGSSRWVAGSCGTSGRVPTDFDGGLLVRRCWDDEACAADLYEALGVAVAALQSSDVLARIDAWEALLAPYAAADPRSGYTPAEFTTQVACIRDWLEARPAELAPFLPADCLGEGGSLDVTGRADLSTNHTCDRDAPDAVAWPVLAILGADVTIDGAPDGVVVGDEVIVAVMQADDPAAVGAFAFAEVLEVGADSLRLDPAPTQLDATAATVVLQRVPRYDDVRIGPTGLLTAAAWDGATGGLFAIRVTGTLTVEDGGRLAVSGLGYAGGATGAGYNQDGYAGESVTGPGLGGADSTAGYNEANRAWAANVGGGGCNVGGGGGEHAGGATAGESWNGVATAPEAGQTYGDAALEGLWCGSGGGGVVNLGGASGPGGAGGGILVLSAGTVVVEGAGTLEANGEDASAWASGSWTYGAGGGAGGSVWIEADALVLPEGALRATGGTGYAAVDHPGGDGGVGRIRVDCATVNGAPCEAAAFEALAEPAAYLGR